MNARKIGSPQIPCANHAHATTYPDQLALIEPESWQRRPAGPSVEIRRSEGGATFRFFVTTFFVRVSRSERLPARLRLLTTQRCQQHLLESARPSAHKTRTVRPPVTPGWILIHPVVWHGTFWDRVTRSAAPRGVKETILKTGGGGAQEDEIIRVEGGPTTMARAQLAESIGFPSTSSSVGAASTRNSIASSSPTEALSMRTVACADNTPKR